MKENEIYLQQGDVILYVEKEIPKNAKRINLNSNEYVVEHGEGIHKHKLSHPQLMQVVQLYEDENKIYFKANQQLELIHEEHGISQIEEGKVISKIKEREFDYESMEARNVLD